MKATLEFNLPEDDSDFYCATKGPAMYASLWDIQQELRKLWKYEELTDEQFKMVERIRDSFHAILEHNDVNLNK